MRLTEIINEVFNTDVSGRIVRATNDLFTTKAEIAGRTIVFNASMYEIGMGVNPEVVWEIEFTERTPGNATYGKSGSGGELQVFSFVIESIKELISRYKPDKISFSSSKSDGNRTSLYKRMAKRINIPGYTLSSVMSAGADDLFTIIKDK